MLRNALLGYFRHCVNIIECTHTHLDGVAYCRNCTCYTFTQLAAQQVCLHQHHLKHVNNALCHEAMSTIASLGDRNFSAPLQSMGLQSYMQPIID